ncbi:hypothetical protein VTJ49DRAFT_983 [Mycothermus thermophilus]|uniref:Uncharacterized protein n=1 Tax=Humicola insolens TaxID=85995 RepID=A0ABR3VDL2_HUMIN
MGDGSLEQSQQHQRRRRGGCPECCGTHPARIRRWCAILASPWPCRCKAAKAGRAVLLGMPVVPLCSFAASGARRPVEAKSVSYVTSKSDFMGGIMLVRVAKSCNCKLSISRGRVGSRWQGEQSICNGMSRYINVASLKKPRRRPARTNDAELSAAEFEG